MSVQILSSLCQLLDQHGAIKTECNASSGIYLCAYILYFVRVEDLIFHWMLCYLILLWIYIFNIIPHILTVFFTNFTYLCNLKHSIYKKVFAIDGLLVLLSKIWGFINLLNYKAIAFFIMLMNKQLYTRDLFSCAF